MKIWSFRAVEILFVLILGVAIVIPQDVFAQNHVVSSTDLQKDVAAASFHRQQSISQLKAFLSTPQALHAMQTAHMNAIEVQNAVAQLSDQELAKLSARTQKTQAAFSAGNIDNHDLLIIIVAIAALILIIVAVR